MCWQILYQLTSGKYCQSLLIQRAVAAPSSSYLIAPLPLERHSEFEQNGYDPCKVDVTHDLK